MVHGLRSLISWSALALLAAGGSADDWPTLHHDAARSGRTEDSPAPPFTPMPKYHWVRLLCSEQINCYAEAIVAGGLVYVGTYAGNMYALHRETGATAWTFKARAAIRHSPAFHEGRLYFGSQDGFIYCVDASTGDEKWKFRTGEGVWTSPAVTGGLVLMGSRDMHFYALREKDGELAWKLKTGAPILCSAAVSGQKVFFASEDGHAYCCDLKTGRLIWKSGLERPLSVRGYFPVVWKDKVIYSVAIADWVNGHAGGLRNADCQFVARRLGQEPKYNCLRKWVEPTDELLRAEQDDIVKRLTARPGRRLVQALDVADGRQTWTPPILYETGNNGGHSPPAVGGDGGLYIVSVSAFDRWGGWGKEWWKDPKKLLYPYGFSRIDPEDFRMTPVNWEHIIGGRWRSWHGAAMEYEEHYNPSIGGDRMYVAHSDEAFGINLKTKGVFEIGGKRDQYAGIWGHINVQDPKNDKKGVMPGEPHPIAEKLGVRVIFKHEMHGPGKGSLAISGRDLFWMTGSMVICVRGK